MTNNPQIYHGEWWVPAVADPDKRFLCHNPEQMMGNETKYIGTLTYYEDEDSTLELYQVPSNYRAKYYHHNRVMWGRDANGHIFTLLNVEMEKTNGVDFTCTKFVVGIILIGEHILDTDDVRYNKCIVQFPYLRNWAFADSIDKSYAGTSVYYKAAINSQKLLECINKEGIWWRLLQRQATGRNSYDLTIEQITEFEIETMNPVSMWTLIHQTEEFAQFLSIVLFCEQNPDGVKFVNKENGRVSFLLYKKEKSVKPSDSVLIKFEAFKYKLPSMLSIWQTNFEKMAPISGYLIESLQKKNRFDVPDFLIIAQALDGFHKRFVNKKDGKDIQKYKDQIEILLNQFKDVKVIEKCHIKSGILTDSRNYYSHLFPDEEIKLAVEGEDLYWLTEKCKILLTCCILNMLGLTNEEINLCCEDSPISQIIDSLPLEID